MGAEIAEVLNVTQLLKSKTDLYWGFVVCSQRLAVYNLLWYRTALSVHMTEITAVSAF